uniref:Uncharacterized protein n=1 Tax=Arundo donax TaxID=35708 RepID=A0A0A9BLF2_ARUDO
MEPSSDKFFYGVIYSLSSDACNL